MSRVVVGGLGYAPLVVAVSELWEATLVCSGRLPWASTLTYATYDQHGHLASFGLP